MSAGFCAPQTRADISTVRNSFPQTVGKEFPPVSALSRTAREIPASFLLVLTFNGNRYTIYNMSTIRESSKSRKGKQRLFSQAGMIAVADARNKGLPITYAAEDRIVREYPDGTIEVLGTIENAPMPALPKKFSIGC
ncbi:MAG: hypothetical protein HDR52_02305 [Treponema sp.]|nr:hypothetical protein [Treponema sp.]